ncbi:hypothetical protein HAX54_037262 [Datura stramonium]|uniref:Uncharacterized protein n=1 Tax=Datura stramonium TaxID=4076 RepID=A0ABS8VI50_DATST|nr:hypothetical protein [Datura stramonium]
MAPKSSKGMVVASSRQGTNRSRMSKEWSNQVKIRGQSVNFKPAALNRLLGTPFLVRGKHVTHVTRKRVCLVFALMTGRLVEEEEVDYILRYDPKRLDATKTKESKGLDGPMLLSISQCNARIDNVLSHLYGMKMLQLRMSGVTEEPLQ